MFRFVLAGLLALTACTVTVKAPEYPKIHVVSPGSPVLSHIDQDLVLSTVRLRVQVFDPNSGMTGERSGSAFPVKCEELEEGKYKVWFFTAAHLVEGSTIQGMSIDFFFDMKNGKWIIGEEATLTFDATLFDINENIDSGIVVSELNFAPKLFEFSNEIPDIGDRMLAIGCPRGESLVITEGLFCRFYDDYSYLISAPIYPGNSGGPVIDMETNKVVGFTSRVATGGGWSPQVITHMGIAVSSIAVLEWLNTINFYKTLEKVV